MANDYLVISSTTNDTVTAKPIVDTKLQKIRQQYGVAMIYDRLGKRGMSYGGRKIQTFEEWESWEGIQTTAATPVGGTTLTVKGAYIARKMSRFYNPATGETIYVTVQPTSPTATSITISATTYGVAALQTLVHTGPGANENYDRMTPLGRSTDSHYDYISTRMESVAYTRDQEFREQYTDRIALRLEDQGVERMTRYINNALLFSTPVDGSLGSTGVYETKGLHYMGAQFNNVVVNGRLSQVAFNHYLRGQLLYRPDGSTPAMVAIMSPTLADSMSNWLNDPAISRNPTGTMTPWGLDMPRIRSNVPGANSVAILAENTMEMDPELQKSIILVNFGQVRPCSFGPDLVERPTAQIPEGVADRGTGARMLQWYRTFGLKYAGQTSAVQLFRGVTGFSL